VPNGQADPSAGIHAAFACCWALEHESGPGEGQLVERPIGANGSRRGGRTDRGVLRNRMLSRGRGNRDPTLASRSVSVRG